MSHPLNVSPLPLPPPSPLPDAAVRLVRLSKIMTRAAVGALLVALVVLALVSVATSRYLEAALSAGAVGFAFFALTGVHRKPQVTTSTDPYSGPAAVVDCEPVPEVVAGVHAFGAAGREVDQSGKRDGGVDAARPCHVLEVPEGLVGAGGIAAGQAAGPVINAY